jgi:hypothetical protein
MLTYNMGPPPVTKGNFQFNETLFSKTIKKKNFYIGTILNEGELYLVRKYETDHREFCCYQVHIKA